MLQNKKKKKKKKKKASKGGETDKRERAREGVRGLSVLLRWLGAETDTNNYILFNSAIISGLSLSSLSFFFFFIYCFLLVFTLFLITDLNL